MKLQGLRRDPAAPGTSIGRGWSATGPTWSVGYIEAVYNRGRLQSTLG